MLPTKLKTMRFLLVILLLPFAQCEDDVAEIGGRAGGFQSIPEPVMADPGVGGDAAVDPFDGFAGKALELKDPLSSSRDRRDECFREEDPECERICESYVLGNWNIDSAFCARRRKEVSGRKDRILYYWTIQNCFDFRGAQMACEIVSGGKLASFRSASDRVFAASYLSGLTNVQEFRDFENQQVKRTGYCVDSTLVNADSPNLNLVWTGLRSATPTSPFLWTEDGSRINARHRVAWNEDLVFHSNRPLYKKDGNDLCAVVGWNGFSQNPTRYAGGFFAVNCDSRAKAVCVKEI